VVGNPSKPRTGAFEITTADGKVYWSKLKNDKFPDPEEAAKLVKEAHPEWARK